METSSNLHKKVSDLTQDDFGRHPVWRWVEDDADESLVMPVQQSEPLPQDSDSLFVACQFCTSDGAWYAGALSVRMSDHKVYLISFPRPDGGFLDVSLNPELASILGRERLSQWLCKPLASVFPIKYQTPFTFNDSERLVGLLL